MSIKEISKMLVRSKRPIDFFGDIGRDQLSKEYKKYAKILHPDVGNFSNDREKYLATEAFKLLAKLYNDGIKEYDDGIYNVIDKVSLYERMSPLFEIKTGAENYKFYEHYCTGEVANIYKGTNGEYLVYLKVATNPLDNELISNEFEVLDSLHHMSLPIVEKLVKVNDSLSFIMREVEGVSMPELMQEYSNGLPAEHVMWMLERILSASGYLHSNYIIHGNIKPEHIIINPNNHNVSLLGFAMCVKDANTDTAKYKIINDWYTALEVNNHIKVMPNTDIYAIGKIAIKLLGGNVENNGMPIYINKEIRDFVRKLVNPNPSLRPNDAWMLWNEVIDLRNKVFGTERFKKLERKI